MMPIHFPLTYNIQSTSTILKTLNSLCEEHERHLSSAE